VPFYIPSTRPPVSNPSLEKITVAVKAEPVSTGRMGKITNWLRVVFEKNFPKQIYTMTLTIPDGVKLDEIGGLIVRDSDRGKTIKLPERAAEKLQSDYKEYLKRLNDPQFASDKAIKIEALDGRHEYLKMEKPAAEPIAVEQNHGNGFPAPSIDFSQVEGADESDSDEKSVSEVGLSEVDGPQAPAPINNEARDKLVKAEHIKCFEKNMAVLRDFPDTFNIPSDIVSGALKDALPILNGASADLIESCIVGIYRILYDTAVLKHPDPLGDENLNTNWYRVIGGNKKQLDLVEKFRVYAMETRKLLEESGRSDDAFEVRKQYETLTSECWGLDENSVREKVEAGNGLLDKLRVDLLVAQDGNGDEAEVSESSDDNSRSIRSNHVPSFTDVDLSDDYSSDEDSSFDQVPDLSDSDSDSDSDDENGAYNPYGNF
jgi:hypothetical protein